MKRRTAFVSMLTTILISTGASAQVADHLQCYKIKDSQTAKRYTATLSPADAAFATAPGCRVKVPAKYLCIDTVKSAVTPAPPGAPAGQAAPNYLCYKTKCPKMTKTPWTGQDQFGSRTLTALRTGLVCAPVTATASCETAGECPGETTDCQAPSCTEGSCGTDNTPAGTPTTTQTTGDCQQLQCDGKGNVFSAPDTSDVPADDGLECTADTCSGGAPVHTPKPDGTPCSLGSCTAGVCLPL